MNRCALRVLPLSGPDNPTHETADNCPADLASPKLIHLRLYPLSHIPSRASWKDLVPAPRRWVTQLVTRYSPPQPGFGEALGTFEKAKATDHQAFKDGHGIQFRQRATKARSGSAPAVVGTQEVTEFTTPRASESPKRQQYCNTGLGCTACGAEIGRL